MGFAAETQKTKGAVVKLTNQRCRRVSVLVAETRCFFIASTNLYSLLRCAQGFKSGIQQCNALNCFMFFELEQFFFCSRPTFFLFVTSGSEMARRYCYDLDDIRGVFHGCTYIQII